MTTFASILLGVAAIGLLIPSAVFFFECALALLARRSALRIAGDVRPRVSILVPAHDEESIISSTVRGLRAHLAPGDELIVVADNCTDETAAIARSAGATVIERHDPDRRGKGFALAFGVDSMAINPPDVVVIVDADCVLSPGGLEHLAGQAMAKGRPVQAKNTVTPPPGAGPLAALSAFAFLVKNVVRPSGLSSLGLPCPLTGTGMAFPASILVGAPLATSALTEDLRLGVDLALAGRPPVLCADAAVSSPMPAQRRASGEQRRRWEYGHLATLFSCVPRLLWQGLRRGRPTLLAMALDLLVPPLSLLVLALGATLGLAIVAGALGASWLPAILLAIAAGGILVGIGVAWLGYGRAELPLSTLVLAPLYVLKKLPMYAGFLRRRERAWVRTERDPARKDEPR
jgi:cellulose synthase/poly-beta-1,6-N-acetylglucosamine synthase-like glycosyltransferase